MSKFVAAASVFAVLGVVAAPAFAQQPGSSDVIASHGSSEPVPAPDQVDRVVSPKAQAQQPSGAPRPIGDGVRVVKPGALLLASFDTNHDGKISPAELTAGAEASFAFADKNGDGVISGFEQNEWAAAVGSVNDVLSNPMTFDVNLDRKVTKQEFVEGIRRIAAPVIDAASGSILFTGLIQTLSQKPQEPAGPTPTGGLPFAAGNR